MLILVYNGSYVGGSKCTSRLVSILYEICYLNKDFSLYLPTKVHSSHLPP